VNAPVLRTLVAALTSPAAACRALAREPRPVALGLFLAVAVTAAATATIPRQLDLLERALAPGGDVLRDLHLAAMQTGLLRLIVVDRLVPPPTLVLAGMLLVIAADPVLAVSEERRRILVALAVAGLAPLLVQRLGELAVTYLSVLPNHPRPGDPIGLPQRFATGPALLWWRDAPVPAWLLAVNTRFNLFAAWCVVIWSIGLRQLDGNHRSGWHVGLPVCCLALAALTTYWFRSLATALVLGMP